MKKILLFSLFLSIIACARESNKLSENKPSEPVINSEVFLNDTIINSVNNSNNVKLYLENTLSMYGYLPDKKLINTKFRDAVNELLITSRINYSNENTELYLINNTTSVPVNVDSNLDNLDAKTLKIKYKKGRGNSDFDKLFDKILKERNKNEISVFVADFIYSPDGKDVVSGLNRLRQNITHSFQNTDEHKELAINILHLESDFHGPYYYNVDNTVVKGIEDRPYYIFVIGKEDNVKKYSQEVTPKLEKYNLLNEYFISPSVSQIDNYSVLPYTLNVGQFVAKGLNTTKAGMRAVTIENPLSHKDSLQLAVSANLNNIPVSNEYLLDVNNYDINSDNVKLLEVGEINNKRIKLNSKAKGININPSDLSYSNGATHVFLFSFPSTYKGEIRLSLKKNIPEWVKKVSIQDGDDDRDIKTNTIKQTQTFGFKDIVKGIFESQYTASSAGEYFRLSIDVNQDKPGSSLAGIIGFILGLGILGIIIFIIIRNKQRK